MRFGVQYNPRPRLDHSSQETTPAYAAHMTTLKSAYNDILCVNLVNGSGDEWVIGSEFYRQVAMARDPAVRHVHFDFHKKCGSSGGNFENLDPLLERINALGGQNMTWSEFEMNSDDGEGGKVTYTKRQRAVPPPAPNNKTGFENQTSRCTGTACQLHRLSGQNQRCPSFFLAKSAFVHH
jgi:hypothetical protein